MDRGTCRGVKRGVAAMIVGAATVRRGMAPQMGPRSLSTFPSGGRTDPPLRGDHAHGGAPLPMMLRAIRAHSAEESARLLCTL